MKKGLSLLLTLVATSFCSQARKPIQCGLMELIPITAVCFLQH